MKVTVLMPENYTVRRLAAASIVLLLSVSCFGYLWLRHDHRLSTVNAPTATHGKGTRNDSALAWKEHRLMLDNTSIRQLAGIIHEQYGIQVRLDDEATADRRISGILPNNNLDVLLQALEATMDFEVDRQGDSITIKKHS